MLLRGLSPAGRPRTKAALRLDARVQRARGPGPIAVPLIWPAARSLSLGSRTVPQGRVAIPRASQMWLRNDDGHVW